MKKALHDASRLGEASLGDGESGSIEPKNSSRARGQERVSRLKSILKSVFFMQFVKKPELDNSG